MTTEIGRNVVSATGVVDASPSEVFDFLRRPANHAALSGDHSVREATNGAEVLELGSKFGMKMKVGVPYRVSSKVTETFDMATAKFPPALRLVGYPKRHEDNVAGSLANLIASFAG